MSCSVASKIHFAYCSMLIQLENQGHKLLPKTILLPINIFGRLSVYRWDYVDCLEFMNVRSWP